MYSVWFMSGIITLLGFVYRFDPVMMSCEVIGLFLLPVVCCAVMGTLES